MTHELGPLPLSVQVSMYEDDQLIAGVRLYTSDQLRTYALAEVEKAVKAEREKFVALCMEAEKTAFSKRVSAEDDYYLGALEQARELSNIVKEWK